REVGADVYAFVHLTIHEYLAAVSLAKREDGEKTFFSAYFNTTLVELEALPMTLGLARDADTLYTMIEQMPESLTYAGLRLRARGLGYGTKINQQHLTGITDRLMAFIRGDKLEEIAFHSIIANCFSLT